MQIGEDDDGAPSDLHRMVAYRFARARPGQAAAFGPARLSAAASAHFCFSFKNCFSNLNSLLDSKMNRNTSVSPKMLIQISTCS
jgi:hypothetical protein